MKLLHKRYIFCLIIIFFSLKSFSQDRINNDPYPSDNDTELKSETLHIKGAISFFGHKKFVVIQNIEDIDAYIRPGANAKLCKSLFQNFELSGHTIIGLNIITDSFEEPNIINHRVYFDKIENTLNVYIDYEDSEQFKSSQIAHPYWFKIPLIEQNPKIRFHISIIPKQEVL